MKEPIATEQIFSPLGHRIGLKYHYADGTYREIMEGGHTKKEVTSTLDNILKKYNENSFKKK